MVKKTIVKKIQSEAVLSYSLEVITFRQSFLIPVMDVRDGGEWRKRAERIEKASNAAKGSKYFKSTETYHGLTYNQSTKKPKPPSNVNISKAD